MNIFVRYCKECGESYDRGTNYDLCKKCRIYKIIGGKKNGKHRKT